MGSGVSFRGEFSSRKRGVASSGSSVCGNFQGGMGVRFPERSCHSSLMNFIAMKRNVALWLFARGMMLRRV
jgi:hypothetical protein